MTSAQRSPRPGAAALVLALALALGFALGGCAPKAGPGGAPQADAQALWRSFSAPAQTEAKSFTLSASLSVASPSRSARLLVRFWGGVDGPVRLDLSSGMGQTFAMWREDQLGWLAVYPGSNQAFTHSDTKAALARLGMPFPFTLKDLAAICAGRFQGIVPASYSGVKRTASGFTYTLPQGSAVGSLTLDFAGNPIHLTGRGVEPWSVELGDFAAPAEGGRPLAQRIAVTSPGGLQAVLRIKKIELSAAPADASALGLTVPPQARHIPLDGPGDVSAPELP